MCRLEYDAVLGGDPQPDTVVNVSDSIHVSLNDLELSNQMATIQPTVSVTAAVGPDAEVEAAYARTYDGLSIPSVRITNVAVTDEPGVVITNTSLTVTEEDGGTGMDQQLRRGVDYCAVCHRDRDNHQANRILA